MRDYRTILGDGELVLDEKPGSYSWEQINEALTKLNISPRIIARVLTALEKVIKEQTTTVQGVGAYTPPLGMSRRDRDKFSSTTAMKKQFDQCVYHMGRKNMLQHCRSMGLSLGHLKDDDIKKTINNMSVRNKRKFLGVADGNGDGTP